MPEPPKELIAGDRKEDQAFEPDEPLYRRFPPEWGDEPDVDAIQLPDISVNRGKYCQPEHVLWSETDQFAGWGVLRFRVKDVPKQIVHAGVEIYTSKVVHAPARKNYPHTEVRAYDQAGIHLDSRQIARIDRGAGLRFRQKILEYAKCA